MHEFMAIADLVITKAGGAIVMECIEKGLPMIITKVLPGQEEGNLMLLKRYGVGSLSTKNEQIYRTVLTHINDKRNKKVQQGFAKLRKKNATFVIAQFIRELLEHE